MKLKQGPYTAFLDSIQSESGRPHIKDAKAIIEHFRPSRQISSHFAPVTFLLDYTTMNYIYVSESCFDLLGYTAKHFLQTGLEEYLSRWHEQDFSIINTVVFPYNISFLKTISSDKYVDYVFSYNYRFKNAEGNYVTVLQRFSYVAGSGKTNPVGMIGVIFDITHFKTDAGVVHTIERCVDRGEGTVNDLVYKKVYPAYNIEVGNLLSTREIQVLKLIAKGLSSKQIADSLQLSINTVNNHRKHMLSKMQCKSSSELTNYAVKHGIV